MDVKQVIVVRRDLGMRKGKMCAQVAHASMAFLTKSYDGSSKELTVSLSAPEREWLAKGFTKIVVGTESEKELGELIQKARQAGIRVHPIVDSGKTEFHGVPTLTCAAFGPDDATKIDKITGELGLL